MAVLNDADALYVGTTAADAAYIGSTQVWTAIDPDAEAFLSAASVTDPTITTAIGDLVVALKAASLWTKLGAIYPIVGGSESTHKFNLKDPRDLNAAFRLTFAGGWTHSATGALPNGSTGYADTHFNTLSEFTVSDASLGFYSRTSNGVGLAYDMGNASSSDTKATICIARYSGDRFFPDVGTGNYPSVSETDGRGFYSANRKSATNTEGYKNGSRVLNVVDAVTLENLSIYIGACNRGGSPMYFGQKQIAFAFLGDGLTSTEQGALYTAVQAFQTTLGRQV